MKVVLYDGECGFCNAAIQFVWKRDRDGLISYAAIQSKAGRELLREKGIAEPLLDTMYYLDGDKLHERSEAALRVGQELPRYQLLASLGLLVPRPIRNWVYDRVASNRSKLMKASACESPPEEVRARFLDSEG